jgi:RNA polymerase sigma-70 factor, ECF subfamily
MPGAATLVKGELALELHRLTRAGRWDVTVEAFGEALGRSAERALVGRATDAKAVERYLRGLQLDDLALACACAAGSDEAWDLFVQEYRPILYRAADALDRSGGGREVADSLYAELFGLRDRGGERQSLFSHFHGRSSLATWLRAVLAQRFVDRARSRRRLDPLPDDESAASLAAPAPDPDPDRARLLPLIWQALRLAIESLVPRNRLRFACYYADGLTLAETGRILGEHEATVSRQLAKTRTVLRQQVARALREEAHLDEVEVGRAFEYAVEDAGVFDLDRWSTRKDPADERST